MKYFEDLYVGERFISEEYEMTEERIIAFAEHYDPQVFHLDHEQAKETFFEGLAASGWHTGSVTMRLMAQTLPIATGVIGGGVDLRWLSPTRPGDILHIEVEVIALAESRSKPDRGTVQIHVETKNQYGDLRQTIDTRLLVFKRPFNIS